jgi:hypothetical protein
MRCDTCPRPEIAQELGAQFPVQVGEQIEGDDGGLANIGLEQVLLEKFHAVDHTSSPGVGAALLNTLGVDVDPHTTGFIALGSGDDHASIPTAEIVDDISRLHRQELQHLPYDVVRRRHILDIGFLGLRLGAGTDP